MVPNNESVLNVGTSNKCSGEEDVVDSSDCVIPPRRNHDCVERGGRHQTQGSDSFESSVASSLSEMTMDLPLLSAEQIDLQHWSWNYRGEGGANLVISIEVCTLIILGFLNCILFSRKNKIELYFHCEDNFSKFYVKINCVFLSNTG